MKNENGKAKAIVIAVISILIIALIAVLVIFKFKVHKIVIFINSHLKIIF